MVKEVEENAKLENPKVNQMMIENIQMKKKDKLDNKKIVDN